MLGLLTSLIPGLFKLGGKLIEDKDKKAEYSFKVLQMSQDLALKMLEVKTYPWIDGLVKLSYAGEQIIKGLFRPIVTAIGFAFGLYFELNEIEVSATVEAILFGSFPAWGASRHIEKAKPKDDWD